MPSQRTCTVPDCQRPMLARELCKGHYYSWRYRNPGAVRVLGGDPQARFWPKVQKGESCWEWTGARDAKGYGKFCLNRQVAYAHRFAYETLVGQIPDGMTIDHLCANKPCVNPSHMEIVTLEENTRRGAHRVTAAVERMP